MLFSIFYVFVVLSGPYSPWELSHHHANVLGGHHSSYLKDVVEATLHMTQVNADLQSRLEGAEAWDNGMVEGTVAERLKVLHVLIWSVEDVFVRNKFGGRMQDGVLAHYDMLGREGPVLEW